MVKITTKVCTILDYIEPFLFLGSTITFASLVGISIETTSSVIGLKIYAITAAINKYKSIVIVNS